MGTPAFSMMAMQQNPAYSMMIAGRPGNPPGSPKMDGPLGKRPRADQPCKQGWTRHEDATILRTVREVGTKWSRIAAQLPGRSDDAVRNRYIRIQRKNSLDASKAAAEAEAAAEEGTAAEAAEKPKDANTVTSKRGDMWTPSEDEAVLNVRSAPAHKKGGDKVGFFRLLFEGNGGGVARFAAAHRSDSPPLPAAPVSSCDRRACRRTASSGNSSRRA